MFILVPVAIFVPRLHDKDVSTICCPKKANFLFKIHHNLEEERESDVV